MGWQGEDMNRENVLKVADAIENLPYERDRSAMGAKPRAFNMASGCGSACCIGAWTAEVIKGGYVSLTRASAALGLNQDQAQALFKPPGYEYIRWDGRTGAQVLRLMAATGDSVTGKQIEAWWRYPWV